MDLAQDGAEDRKTAEERLRDDCVSVYTNIEGTFTKKVKSQLPFLYMSMGRGCRSSRKTYRRELHRSSDSGHNKK